MDRAAVWWGKFRADAGIIQALHCKLHLIRAFELVQVGYFYYLFHVAVAETWMQEPLTSQPNLTDSAGWEILHMYARVSYHTNHSIHPISSIMMSKLASDVLMVELNQ